MNPPRRPRRATVAALCLLSLASAASAPPLRAQEAASNPAGTWRAAPAAGAGMWRAVFRIDGPRLIGVVGSCASLPGQIEIADGRIDRGALLRMLQCPAATGVMRSQPVVVVAEKLRDIEPVCRAVDA